MLHLLQARACGFSLFRGFLAKFIAGALTLLPFLGRAVAWGALKKNRIG
jgi:hypothetical protein